MGINDDLRDKAGLENTEATSRERVERDIDSPEIRSRLTGDEQQQSADDEDTNGGAPSRQTSNAKNRSGQL